MLIVTQKPCDIENQNAVISGRYLIESQCSFVKKVCMMDRRVEGARDGENTCINSNHAKHTYPWRCRMMQWARGSYKTRGGRKEL